jgi:hypothetical protein
MSTQLPRYRYTIALNRSFPLRLLADLLTMQEDLHRSLIQLDALQGGEPSFQVAGEPGEVDMCASFKIAALSRDDIVRAGFPHEIAAAFSDEEMAFFAQKLFEAYHDRFSEDLYEMVQKHLATVGHVVGQLARRDAAITLPAAAISSNLLVGYLTRDGGSYPLCESCLTHEPVVRVIFAPEALGGGLICAQCQRFLIVEAVETATQEDQSP